MKSLTQFIMEKQSSKKFTFNFDGFDNVDELIKSYNNMENVTVEDNKVTISVNKDSINSIDAAIDMLQQNYDAAHSSTRRSSDEQYAQKVKKFGETLDSVRNYINELNGDDNVDKQDTKTAEETEETKEKEEEAEKDK